MGKRSDQYVSSRVNSVIGKGTTFEGTIHTVETFRVEGTVKGNIISEGTLIIGNGGYVDGVIESVNIMVGGEIHGKIHSTGRIEVNPSGRVFGDIVTKRLIVDDKAIFQGTCVMLDDLKEKEAKEAEEKSPDESATED